jgi:hypothetical protein
MEISTKSYGKFGEMDPGHDFNNLRSVHSERMFVFWTQACAIHCGFSGYRLKYQGDLVGLDNALHSSMSLLSQ